MKLARSFHTAALTACLGACVAGPAPEIATPVPDLPPSFFYAPDVATDTSVAALLPQDDPAFRELSERVIAEAPRLAEAAARIEEARADARRAGAERLPLIGADASVTGTRTNPSQFGGTLPPNVVFDTERVAYGANLTASWDPDLFGQLRARERAAVARIDAADAAASAVRIALLSELAAAIVDWRSLTAREGALQEDLDAALELARLAGVRERSGLAPGFDRVRAEATANASRSRLAALANERARLVGRVVTLTALPAGEVRVVLALSQGQPDLAPAPRLLPSLLLANRPDILRAAALLAAEDAELAATARSRFPQFDLGAIVGLLSFSPGDLFDEDSIVGTLAASVAAPLVDFGRTEAEIDQAAARKRAAFASYRNAVYQGLGDVETAYGLIDAADAEYAALIAERDSAQRAARLADTRYRAGLADFLTVLEARRAADDSAARAATAFGAARRARILLWQAIGGEPQPPRSDVQNGNPLPSEL